MDTKTLIEFGKEEHNQSLSIQREKGARAANIKTDGKGDSNSVAQNYDAHNYLNRRAELMVIQ